MTDRKSIEHIFSAFDGKRILIIGDVMVDAYLFGKVDRISPEAPVPVVALSKREYRLGGAANVALNIRNLGGIPVLCTVTGKDEKGELFRQLLRDASLSDEGIIDSPGRMTTTKFRIVGNNAQMLRVDEEMTASLLPEETQTLYAKILELCTNNMVDAVVFEDYDKGVISPELIGMVVNLAKMRKIPVAVDPKKRNFMDYHGVELFKPNLKELKEGLKLDKTPDDQASLREAVNELQQRMKQHIVMVTLSDKGIYFCQHENGHMSEDLMLGAHLRKISDVSGAGDTVIGTAALCMATGVSPALMTALCNLAGGLVCEYVGVVPINKDLFLKEALTHLC